jgi:hypothetical protein
MRVSSEIRKPGQLQIERHFSVPIGPIRCLAVIASAILATSFRRFS